mgnify:CR=1 FL=1
MKKISSRLREIRGDLSQAKIAQKIGVSQVTWGRWELGTREPSIDDILKICSSEMVSSDWLLGLSDSRGSGISVSASGGSVAANHSTVRTGGGEMNASECSRLLGIIESQQAIIASLTAARKDG